MNQSSWNTRYEQNATVYGTGPNAFFKEFIDTHKPGSILLPAEGEGRNALYAAQKGWKVDAFDFSSSARARALAAAASNNLHMNYSLLDIADYRAVKQYDAVALIFVHLPPAVRRAFHRQVHMSLRPGGFVVLQAFAPEQLEYASGGPTSRELLYDAPSICDDFPFTHILSCGQKEIVLNEGPFHHGSAAVLQMIGQKL
ncbi:MAG TPA: class I SAM-dependent methyltransferase [Flavisolibacter sp.]